MGWEFPTNFRKFKKIRGIMAVTGTILDARPICVTCWLLLVIKRKGLLLLLLTTFALSYFQPYKDFHNLLPNNTDFFWLYDSTPIFPTSVTPTAPGSSFMTPIVRCSQDALIGGNGHTRRPHTRANPHHVWQPPRCRRTPTIIPIS